MRRFCLRLLSPREGVTVDSHRRLAVPYDRTLGPATHLRTPDQAEGPSGAPPLTTGAKAQDDRRVIGLLSGIRCGPMVE